MGMYVGQVRGRGVRPETAQAVATFDSAGATLRIEDAANPEFWLELRLSRTDLLLMLEAVDAAKAELEAEGGR